MTETLSVRIDPATKEGLERLAKRSKRSKSFLAAEAIAAYVEAEEWQLGEIESGLKELDRARGVGHIKSSNPLVLKWVSPYAKLRRCASC